ncbi:voltage-gated purine nucleotide uniporter SLC17A9-like [Saccoglossus kowalevskii]|uniref:Solute carrier family 17 member 9-like n=1 Tax=Saccoglossus kowalevskii TaxID=10224 RepID=A0ABM0H1F7_SACKO|nr:PREDICTED: solute carrier family 17 member 9-like [Saccoglossus kowalevskii]
MAASIIKTPSTLQISLSDPQNSNTAATAVHHWTRAEKRAWTIALFTGTAITYAARNAIPLCAVALSKEFSWNKTETGLILSSFFWGYALTQILSGYISDRYGGDYIVTLAAMCWGALTLLTPYLAYMYEDKSSQLKCLVFLRVIYGALQAFHYPSMTSLMGRKVDKSCKSYVYTTVISGTYAGNLLSGSLGSIVLSYYDWHRVFYIFGTCAILWALMVRIYLMKQRLNIRLFYNGIIKTPEDVLNHSDTLSPSSVPWRALARHPGFWAMVLGHFCLNYTFFLLFSWLPTYFTEKYPEEKGWVFNVVPWIVSIPSSIATGYVADSLVSFGYTVTTARKCIHTIASLGIIVCLILIGQSEYYNASLTFAATALVFQSFSNAGVLTNPQDIAPQWAGSVFGVMNTAGAMPGFIGVYITGHILEYTQSWATVFGSASCVVATGWVIFMLFGTGSRII